MLAMILLSDPPARWLNEAAGLVSLRRSFRLAPIIPVRPVKAAWKLSQAVGDCFFISLAYVCQCVCVREKTCARSCMCVCEAKQRWEGLLAGS